MSDYSEAARALVPFLEPWMPSHESTRDLGRGAAFPLTATLPGGLAAGDRFFRTDLGFLCYYDGTRWLTVHEDSLALFSGGTLNTLLDFSATDSFAFVMRLRTDYAPYFTRCAITTRVLTTNNGANNWLIGIDAYNTSFSAGTTIYSFSTGTTPDTAATYTDHEGAASVPTPAHRTHLVLSVQKSGSPGVLRVFPTIFYRLVIP